MFFLYFNIFNDEFKFMKSMERFGCRHEDDAPCGHILCM